MTETQTRQTQPQQANEPEIAAAIALILAGGVSVPSVTGAIAALLRMIPGMPDSGDGDVSVPVSRMVSRVTRGTGTPLDGEVAVSASNLSYRAHYAIEAMKRVASDVSQGNTLKDALNAERINLTRHLEASETREAGARLNQAAAERWGPVLSWNHTGKSSTHRPSHVAANGANYDVRNPPQSTEGLLPGQAPHCDCLAGPPIPGARMLT